MRSVVIENKLIAWFEMMMKKYSSLSYKYEYSERRRVYLVSAIVDLDEDSYEHYCLDSMAFEDELANLYGDEAPLFTDNEQLFKLSSDARVARPYVETKELGLFNLMIQYLTNHVRESSFSNQFVMCSKPSCISAEPQYCGNSVYSLAA